MLMTYVCIDLEGNGNNSVFQYEVENEAEALEKFETESEGRYEINDTFIEK